nr:hypothetical protein [Candidatus Freyarchaeota archaeon]
MPVFGKDKKEGYLDPSTGGQPAMNPQSRKDSDTLNEVKSGIERLSQILSTYLSSFEERLGKIEKQVGNLDLRLTTFEESKMKITPSTGVIRVPSELVEDATRTEPIITKKRPEAETPSIPAPTIPPGLQKAPTATPPKPPLTIPKVETRVPEAETVSVPPKGPETPPPTRNIPLSKEAPVAEHFFDELRTRITTKSAASPESKAYTTTPERVTPAVTKQTAQAPVKEGTPEKSEEDIKKVLERLKDSIKKAE